MPHSQPNILVIMSDQHHAGVLGSEGDRVVDTPCLDALAARGVRFAQAYCPSPLCGPSRMAFMTARQPHETGVWSNECSLNSDVPTFAHGFLAGGYQTVLSGRMHFVGTDQRHGFQTRLVGDVPESAYLAAGWQLTQVLGDLVDTPGYSVAGLRKSGPGRTGYHAYDERVTEVTCDWLRQRGRAPAMASPFLLVVGYAAPHCPFVAPPEDFAHAARRIGPADLPAPDLGVHPWLAQMRRRAGVDPPPPRQDQWRARVAYYGLCRFLDRQVAAVLAALTAAGLADDTIVVYTSDHGEMLGEHGWWWKSTFYEGACRVPLLIAGPPLPLPAGRPNAVGANVSLLDLGPTLLDLAGLPPLPGVSGRSFAGFLRAPAPTAWPDRVFAELAGAGGPEHPVQPQRMVRSGPWKYVYYHDAGETLHHLADDPHELRDVAADPQMRPVVAELRAAALAGWDPVAIERRLATELAERQLIRCWLEAVRPPEPDPLWFAASPPNWVDTSPQWSLGTPGSSTRQDAGQP